jgi:hypothetical protein
MARASMKPQFEFDGLNELQAALKAAPAALRRALVPDVNRLAASLAREVEGAYPMGPTGNLKKGVRVTHVADEGTGLLVARVATTARHSRIYENGTVPRKTHRGAKRGRMEPANIFVPAAIRHRADLYALAERALATLQVPGLENDGRAA